MWSCDVTSQCRITMRHRDFSSWCRLTSRDVISREGILDHLAVSRNFVTGENVSGNSILTSWCYVTTVLEGTSQACKRKCQQLVLLKDGCCWFCPHELTCPRLQPVAFSACSTWWTSAATCWKNTSAARGETCLRWSSERLPRHSSRAWSATPCSW